MANILLNALASTAGGGVTYLRNVLPRVSQWQKTHRFTALVPHQLNTDWLGAHRSSVSIARAPCSSALGARLWWEQTSLRGMLQRQKIDALVSLGNFALLNSPVPQILFSRNELYFSDYFTNDLWQRRAWRMLADHGLKSWLARVSLRAAQYHVVPTAAMATRLRATGVPDALVNVLPFGFDSEIFVEQKKPLAAAQAVKLAQRLDALKLLYVSHYNYFRNFETLLRALPLIKKMLKEKLGRRVQLVLTTHLQRGADYGGYDTARAVELIERLNLTDDLVMLGAVAYDQLSEVYQACDLFVCPSYAESFGHPLLEAMASGLPVIAANLPVHREVCQDAAIYFDVFDENQLAAQAARVLNEEQLRSQLINAGQARVKHFSWDAHVNGLVRLIETVLDGSNRKMSINE